VLVADGAHDVMISAFPSYATSQRLPGAKVARYSGAGRCFRFHYPRTSATKSDIPTLTVGPFVARLRT
jgi:hypothetical protein